MAVWRRISDDRSGYPYHLSESLSLVEWRNPGILTPLKDGEFVIVSDYSGQHKAATHEAYSFLTTTDNAINDWLPFRDEFRKQWLPDGRRMSYKKLSEPVRRRALIPFLVTASLLRANLITILVDRRTGSFFGDAAEISNVFPDCFPQGTRPSTVEKMLRIASFLAMFLAGLKDERQPGLWVSDHDEALENNARRENFALLARYITFGLTRWLQPADVFFTTTEAPMAPPWGEDIAAITDIVAGAYCSLSSVLPSSMGQEAWTRVVSTKNVDDARAIAVGNWMALSHKELHPVLLRLEPNAAGEIRASAQFYKGAVQPGAPHIIHP